MFRVRLRRSGVRDCAAPPSAFADRDGIESVGDGDEFAAGERAAQGSALDKRTRVVGECKRQGLLEQEHGLSGLLLQLGDRSRVVDGREREGALAGHRRVGMARQRLADAGELQQFQRPPAQFRPRG